MNLLVDCSHCKTPLNLPPYATSVRCSICHAVTHIAVYRSIPQPTLPRPPQASYHFPPEAPPPVSPFSHPHPQASYHIPKEAPPSVSPFNHPSPSIPLHPAGVKRAVICAVSYRNTNNELKGTLNDAKCMKFLLINKFMFPESSILMLNEEDHDPSRLPTKKNIRLAMKWLVKGCRAGDSLVFHFSGHGSQQENKTGDELDGYDETLLPLDFESQGIIVDDEINDVLVKPLPRGAKLHAVIDACHSGTVLDLPFLCRMDRYRKYEWEDQRPRSGAWKGTNGGEAISFSGCDDDQVSSDSMVLSNSAYTGAMTFAFIQAIESGHGTTYGSLLTAMRATVRNHDFEAVNVSALLVMLLAGASMHDFGQEPQLCSNEPFDIYSKPFSI